MQVKGGNNMTEKEQKKAAKEFAERWKGRGYEKGESNLFWIDLLTHVYGVDNIADFIRFEDHVHCVIVGFSIAENKADRRLFDNGAERLCNNISPYLISSETIFIDSRSKPISNVENMISGNRPADGGYLILSQEEKDELIVKEPQAERYIKQFMMGYEFINNVPRYCLWLVNISPAELKKMPNVLKRVELCKQDRLNGAPDRQKLADTPTIFREQLNPDRFIALPVVSSQQRKYIPMGYLNGDIIAGNKLFIIPDATIYDFGVLTSNVHMAWMRAVGGRLKSDYSYSKNVVYNNFPWCSPTNDQKAAIEHTAQMILDARAKYPDCSLADLYDETTKAKIITIRVAEFYH